MGLKPLKSYTEDTCPGCGACEVSRGRCTYCGRGRNPESYHDMDCSTRESARRGWIVSYDEAGRALLTLSGGPR